MSRKRNIRDEVPSIVAIPAGWIWASRVREALSMVTFEPRKESIQSNWLAGEFLGLTSVQPTQGADVTG